MAEYNVDINTGGSFGEPTCSITIDGASACSLEVAPSDTINFSAVGGDATLTISEDDAAVFVETGTIAIAQGTSHPLTIKATAADGDYTYGVQCGNTAVDCPPAPPTMIVRT